mmetsp:Transcript_124522/g.363588  ORF Transcript_124522/g.363588 Transcript_124522/m.363588 type:complete len:297 (-) Transcript_124522:97-987(-)
MVRCVSVASASATVPTNELNSVCCGSERLEQGGVNPLGVDNNIEPPSCTEESCLAVPSPPGTESRASCASTSQRCASRARSRSCSACFSEARAARCLRSSASCSSVTGASTIRLMRCKTSKNSPRSSSSQCPIIAFTATRMSWPQSLSSSPGTKCSGEPGSPRSSSPSRMPRSVLPTIALMAASQSAMLGRPSAPAPPVPPFGPSALAVSVPPTLPPWSAPVVTAPGLQLQVPLEPRGTSKPNARSASEISSMRASALAWDCSMASQSDASTATRSCEARRVLEPSRVGAGLPPLE